ncbi:MAG: putative bifunctional diguanylate cyclase/phosphodiesterase, partial [Acidiferrobacterales bacterium]
MSREHSAMVVRPFLDRVRTLVVRLSRGFKQSRRSLIGHIQLLQLALGIIVYLLAVAGVWWTANRLSEDYVHEQAARWLTKLDELGTPLYLSRDPAEFASVQKHVSEFPGVAFVRYYSAQGDQVIAEYDARPSDNKEIPRLSEQHFASLRAMQASETPYLFEEPTVRRPFLRASAPLWITSIQSDGLLEFDLDNAKNEKLELIGFLEVGLDFSDYQGQLLKNIALGSLIIAVLLIVSIVAGRQILKRALRPLSDLEKPLAQLANGEIDVRVERSGHKEIVAISDALNVTITALKERDETLRQLADHDQLTGLVNRHHFTQKLEQEVAHIAREGGSSALLFLDLDQFKLVNDTLGHVAGDRLLVQVADKLSNSLREDDVICRFGGDEFTILARNVTAESATDLARSIIRVMREVHFVEAQHVFNICCSIGVAMIDSDPLTPDELLGQADMACYDAKSQGRNCYSFFARGNGDTEQMRAYIGWAQKVKEAVDNDHFVLNFQPIINLDSGQTELYEVLLRMPDQGAVISPTAFLPIAERFGLMLDIDYWVIRNAMKCLAALQRAGGDAKFCINLSGHIFEDPKLVQSIREGLELNGLSPSSIVFEITEQVAIRYLDNANQRMRELMDIGCRFALDDFGAGFSSLTYVKRLPVDYIKIEGSFIENMSKDSID